MGMRKNMSINWQELIKHGALLQASFYEDNATKSKSSDNSYPAMYELLMVSDGDTPMDFVVVILMNHFHQTFDEATSAMLKINKDGMAVCGLYTKDVAETKAYQIMDLAKRNKYPLKCVIRKISKYVIKKS